MAHAQFVRLKNVPPLPLMHHFQKLTVEEHARRSGLTNRYWGLQDDGHPCIHSIDVLSNHLRVPEILILPFPEILITFP